MCTQLRSQSGFANLHIHLLAGRCETESRRRTRANLVLVPLDCKTEGLSKLLLHALRFVLRLILTGGQQDSV